MDKRLTTLFNLAGEGEVFLDIGCDHGLVSLNAIKSGKFKRIIITDISQKSLQKAISLLKPYGDKVKAVVTDGFNGITDEVSVAFIAGMGGEEISKILVNALKLPQKLVLSPQKNSEKVRRTLISLGYKILRDFTFFECKKYYDGILAVKGEDFYTQDEYLFGRENLQTFPSDFVNKLQKEIEFKTSLIGSGSLNKGDADKMSLDVIKLKEILNENTKRT